MDTLWIETGDMSGGSRNQIEFDRDLAEFFTNTIPGRGSHVDLMIRIHDRPWVECKMAAKKTTYGVDIYRLGLVTAAQGGEDYPGKVIRFDRRGGRYFGVTVVALDSPEHAQWRQESSANGTLGRTGGAGGREFGFA